MASQDSLRITRPPTRRFRLLTGFCLLASLGLTGCGDPNQAVNVGSALSRASRTNQLVLVEFWAFSDACAQMDNKVYTNPMVLRDLEGFVRARMNYAMNRDTAANLGVTGAPGFAALRLDGSVIAASTGPLDADGLRQFLIRARIFR